MDHGQSRDDPHRGTGDIDGPYINAPVWPWLTAGWLFSALYVVLLLIARSCA